MHELPKIMIRGEVIEWQDYSMRSPGKIDVLVEGKGLRIIGSPSFNTALECGVVTLMAEQVGSYPVTVRGTMELPDGVCGFRTRFVVNVVESIDV